MEADPDTINRGVRDRLRTIQYIRRLPVFIGDRHSPTQNFLPAPTVAVNIIIISPEVVLRDLSKRRRRRLLLRLDDEFLLPRNCTDLKIPVWNVTRHRSVGKGISTTRDHHAVPLHRRGEHDRRRGRENNYFIPTIEEIRLILHLGVRHRRDTNAIDPRLPLEGLLRR